ncbi:MAG: nitrate ABC transporter permease [Actinobacteria bacterium]|nr:nitrate ABC transporter permease [Actinomycetota bacterium]
MTILQPAPPQVEPSGAETPIPEPAPAASPAATRTGAAVRAVAWSLVGAAVVIALWSAVALSSPDLPTPPEALRSLQDLLSNPFYDNGPNDKGIGVQLLASLQRVFLGFVMATAVGVPLGFLIGGSRRAWQAANPIVQLLRPVSPLAWFPIGLVVLKDAPNAAVFVIFITALWPTVINTAAGAASVPRDHRNVARVFKFGRFAYVRHVMVPHTLPSIITGLRLSMGVAWMVIVAVEMLSGGTGVGFFVWNSYNGSDLPAVVAAIILIGAVGVVLDTAFVRLGRRFAPEEVTT